MKTEYKSLSDYRLSLFPDIRKLVLNEGSGVVKKMLLTPRQIVLLKSIKGEVTSKQLAEQLNTSVQNAGQKLQWLCCGGYLASIEKKDPTGGYYFAYKRTVFASDERSKFPESLFKKTYTDISKIVKKHMGEP